MTAMGDRRTRERCLVALVRLALGRAPDRLVDREWDELLSLAERERLTGVAWLRSSAAIRSDAPERIAAAWQRRALVHGVFASRQLRALSHVVASLVERGLSPVVLKGPPLGHRLYGDFTVRTMTDLDLYLPETQRAVATETLVASGWRRSAGEAPEEETFERSEGPHRLLLEVHSAALDDPLLAHVRLAVEQRPVGIGDTTLPAHEGRFLPAFLAAHLAKHISIPMLWILDIHSLWSSFDRGERADAQTAAMEVGLHRHLRWALRLSQALGEIAHSEGIESNALRRLEHQRRSIGNARRVLRLVSLSASPVAALDVLRGRFLPQGGAAGWLATPGQLVYRAARWAYRRSVFERPTPSEKHQPAEAVPLDHPEAARRVVEALSFRSPVWVSPRSASMEPAIPSFARARIVTLGDRIPQVGDVLLVRASSGGCLLERVTAVDGDSVRLKADAHERQRSVVSFGELLGVCDLVEVGGNAARIEERPHDTVGMLRAIARGLKPRAASTGSDV